jgi:DNA-binding transcriptional MerR regulator
MAQDPPLPDKVYFRIGEVAALLGVETHVVRFWQQQFPAVRPERSDSRRYLYTRAAVERLLRIRALLYDQGYTIAGARRALIEERKTVRRDDKRVRQDERVTAPISALAQPPVPVPDPALQRQLAEMEAELERARRDLRGLQARLEASEKGEAAARARETGLVAAAERLRAELTTEIEALAALAES